MADLRFNRLERAALRMRVKEAESEEEPLTPKELAAIDLEAWASDPICKRVFMPYLDWLILEAETSEEINVESHVKLACAMEVKKALRALREDFRTWAGQA